MERQPPPPEIPAKETDQQHHLDREALQVLTSQYGARFLAYLQIADNQQPIESLKGDFLARYEGAYYDFEEFARTRLTEIGIEKLSEDLGVELTETHPDDIYLIGAHLRKLYDGITIDSHTYIFRREPKTEESFDKNGLAFEEPLQIDPVINPPKPRIEISWPGLVGPKPQSRRHLRILEELYDAYNTVFEVYLTHIWKNTPIENIEDDLVNVYQGSYSSVSEFIDALAELLDWKSAIETTMREVAIPPGALAWNYRTLHADLQRDFEFHQMGNQVHVFHK